MKIDVQEVEDLKGIAKALLAFNPKARFYVINGPMGAGKTTFTKALCHKLGVADRVSSPTFSIVNEYLGTNTKIYHFDFYRLKNINEAYDIGYEEYFYGDGICIIEWAEKVAQLLPEEYTQIDITITGPTTRTFKFSNIK